MGPDHQNDKLLLFRLLICGFLLRNVDCDELMVEIGGYQISDTPGDLGSAEPDV